MNSKLNKLLQLGIATSLSDRDTAIDKISSLLQNKMGTDPEKSMRIGEQIFAGIENLRDQLTLDQVLSSFSKNEDNLETKIGDLTEAVNKLNTNLENLIKVQSKK